MPRLHTTVRRPVDLVEHISVPAERAIAVFDAAPANIVGSGTTGPAPASATLANLSTGLGGGRTLTRDVRVGFGPAMDDDGDHVLPVWWEDAEHPYLFPAFDGGLELRRNGEQTDVRLVGSYQPPLGPVGRFADGLAGHRVVIASLEAFLHEVAGRLEEAADAT